jgi:magnesium chelatase subunit I
LKALICFRLMQTATPPPSIPTLGELRASGYRSRSVRDEMRENLVAALRHSRSLFGGILGFDDTVIPDLERAILSRHHILLLGLRGQAKTRLARTMVGLLDEWMPCLQGTELPEDPLRPITAEGKALVEAHGDQSPVRWMHRTDRYVEKLATPDVSIADLIGDVDPIKAASLKLSYSDERVIHYGLIPRAHRGLFVINELPDLQPRIQVALFNILQEGDIQIRGFHKRLALDVAFLFTANPEDYTNRGSIITPLKDRIDSQILTHYPADTAISQAITRQEVRLTPEQIAAARVPALIHEVLDQIAFEARESEWVDPKSGVSARLNISAYENLVSAVERRILLNGDPAGQARINDFWAVTPAITGKVELVYEGEQEGPYQVALHLMNQAIRNVFLRYFPHPEKKRAAGEKDPYGVVQAWFAGGNHLPLPVSSSEAHFRSQLRSVSGLEALARASGADEQDLPAVMELILHGLAAFQQIGKELLGNQLTFRDELAGALGDLDLDED